jgi:hypothetical protein
MALGDLYGKPVNDSLYSDFKIIKKSEKRNILIYSISTTNFRNTLGKENIPINSENFFGYYVLVLTKMNMDIEPRFKVQGKILKSDPIDIVWDDSKNVFKVLLSP